MSLGNKDRSAAVEPVSIDVLMPVFNEDPYIEKAISSILEADHSPFNRVRVIVGDDFSTDRTPVLLAALKQKFRDSLTICRAPRKGKNHAFNEAFARSSAPIICFMGGDDLLVSDVLHDRAKPLIDLILNNPNVIAATGCRLLTFSEDSRYDGVLIPKKRGKGSLSGGAIMMTRSLADIVFPVPTTVPNEDSWMNLCIRYLGAKIIYVPKIGLRYRIHKGNSHKRGQGYEESREAMWARSRVYLIFYASYWSSLSSARERELLKECFLEVGKYLGLTGALMATRGISMRDRAVGFVGSSKLGHKMKQALYRFLVGR